MMLRMTPGLVRDLLIDVGDDDLVCGGRWKIKMIPMEEKEEEKAWTFLAPCCTTQYTTSQQCQ
jgi:hypothetical protein